MFEKRSADAAPAHEAARPHTTADALGSSPTADGRFRSLVEQLPLSVYIDRLDAVSSNIYTSPQIEQMLGYSVAEWVENPDLFVGRPVVCFRPASSSRSPRRPARSSRSARGCSARHAHR